MMVKMRVQKILTNDYDLILVDWMLPYKDGIKLFKNVVIAAISNQ